jgi:Cys-rich protein (TIGR01571 family)
VKNHLVVQQEYQMASNQQPTLSTYEQQQQLQQLQQPQQWNGVPAYPEKSQQPYQAYQPQPHQQSFQQQQSYGQPMLVQPQVMAVAPNGQPMVMMVGQQPMIAPSPMTNPFFHTGLCDCFKDVKGCLDGLFCGYCQNARQYNLMKNNVNSIHPGACFVPFLVDMVLPVGLFLLFGIEGFYWFGTIVMTYMNRSKVRQRYGLQPAQCTDILSAWCCAPCTICQNYRELSIRGSWPNGVCVSEPFLLPGMARPMEQEMR